MRSIPRLTQLRAARLARGLSLERVSKAAGMSRTRASIVERNPSVAKAGEYEKLLTTIERLAMSSEAVGSPEMQSNVREMLSRIGILLSDIVASGEVTAAELSDILNIEQSVITETLAHAVMIRDSATRHGD